MDFRNTYGEAMALNFEKKRFCWKGKAPVSLPAWKDSNTSTPQKRAPMSENTRETANDLSQTLGILSKVTCLLIARRIFKNSNATSNLIIKDETRILARFGMIGIPNQRFQYSLVGLPKRQKRGFSGFECFKTGKPVGMLLNSKLEI
jgi:hypothetical protein